MTAAEDPAVVLEQFTNDASNLAPEIMHLMEEIEAKDQVVRECEAVIKQRDLAIQRHIKSSGPGVPFPREDGYVKTVMQNYERALAVQEEKQILADKAAILLARHTKRLDAMIRDLAANGGLELDDSLSSLLNGTANGRNGAVAVNGAAMAHVVSGGAAATAPPSTTLANSNLARLVTNNLAAAANGRANSPSSAPASATQARGSRESSTDAKRRRLNLPAQGSNLRQSSTGPGTPKAGTPQPGGSSGAAGGARAGSVPRGTNKKDGKAGPSNKLLVPPKSGPINPDSKAAKARKRKGGPPAPGGGRRKGGVSDADDSALSNAGGDDSADERLSNANGDAGASGNSVRPGKEGPGDASGAGGSSGVGGVGGGGGHHHNHRHHGNEADEDDDEDDAHDVAMGGVDDDDDDEGGDTNLYCTCRSVSYGNMVACDSDDCPYEWFHWNCVGLTKEPPGKWYCVECKARLGMK